MKLQDVRINDRRYDRRCKLSEEQRVKIMERKNEGAAVKATAREFGVHPRTIQFMWYPERREKNKKDTAELQVMKDVNWQERQAKNRERHNTYKRRLANKRLIDLPISALYHDHEYVWPFKSFFGIEPEYIERNDGMVVKIININKKHRR